MNESELTIEFKKEGSSQVEEITVTVDLDEYAESYSEDLAHLQDYKEDVIKAQIYPIKKDWCEALLKSSLPEKSEAVTKPEDMVDELDGAVIEYQEEISDEQENDD